MTEASVVTKGKWADMHECAECRFKHIAAAFACDALGLGDINATEVRACIVILAGEVSHVEHVDLVHVALLVGAIAELERLEIVDGGYRAARKELVQGYMAADVGTVGRAAMGLLELGNMRLSASYLASAHMRLAVLHARLPFRLATYLDELQGVVSGSESKEG